MNRILVIDQQKEPAKKAGPDFFKSFLEKNSHQIVLQLSDVHPSVDVKIICMEHLALVTSTPDIFIHLKIEDLIRQLLKRALFVTPSHANSKEANCQAFAIQCLNNLSCSSEDIQFENILLSSVKSQNEMLEKFERLITSGNPNIINEMVQLIMRFMSSMQGKKMISSETSLIGKLVQTCCKDFGRPGQEIGEIDVNKDGLIILLHSLFDYDEQFMRDRINQELMIEFLKFL